MGKILCLDIGAKKTGLAISDTERKMAFMRPEIFHNNPAELVMAVSALVAKENIQTILVGMPFSLSGQIPDESNSVVKILEDLKKICADIRTMDERFTTKIAKSRSSKGEHDDSQAALILLETYLRIKA